MEMVIRNETKGVKDMEWKRKKTTKDKRHKTTHAQKRTRAICGRETKKVWNE